MGVKKCKLCGEQIKSSDETVGFKGNTVHRKCFVAVMHNKEDEQKLKKYVSKGKEEKEQEPEEAEEIKNVSKIKVPVTEVQYQEKRKVLNYITQLTGAKPTAKIYKLIEDYSNKYGFTFDGIFNALFYYFEALGNAPNGDCIGIIPYVYEDAQKYMDQIKEAEKVNTAISQEEFNNMYKTVSVKLKRKEVKTEKEIDIGRIPV